MVAIPHEFSSYTPNGELKSSEELAKIAHAIIPKLNAAQKMAMLELVNGSSGWRDALPVRTDTYPFEKLGITRGFSRSGDNAYPLLPLGIVVRDILLSEG